MIQHLREQRFTHALTLAWNADIPLHVAREHLKALHGIVDGKLLGCRYNRKPLDQRTPAVFVFEGVGPGGHLHVHSLWRIGDRRHLLKFARLFPGERGGPWSRLAPSGSYKLAINDDPVAFAGYALKAQHMSSADREIVWYREFLRD